MEPVKKLPYKEISEDHLIGRVALRASELKRKDLEAYMIPFDKIKIRNGFNVRTVYTDIEELAESIRANGLIDPIVVDIMEDGIAYVERGHRRYHALLLLRKAKWLQTADVQGIVEGSVLCFRNHRDTTELDRIKNMITSNHSVPLTNTEKTAVVLRMKEHYGMSNETIGKEMGMSRQTIDNLLLLASSPEALRNCVDEGLIKPTAAVALVRKFGENEETLEKIVTNAQLNGQVLRGVDVENMDGSGKIKPVRFTGDEQTYIGGDNDAAELNSRKTKDKALQFMDPDADDEETSSRGGRERITETKDEETWCSEVIGNLDKINVMVAKLPTAHSQLIKDVDTIIRFAIPKMESIREYIKNVKPL